MYTGLLESAQRAANKVSGREDVEHSFTTIQLPANLIEKEALKHAVLWAERNKIHVLVNRPLNAIHTNKMYRLAD